MSYPLQYNCEGYYDPTRYKAMKNIEKDRAPGKSPDWEYWRGDLYIANLDGIGSEQTGTRPVVVLQNNIGNIYCPTLVVAPITSRSKASPVHYMMPFHPKLHGPATVLLEQITTIDKRRIQKYIGKLNDRQMRGITEKIQTSIGYELPYEVEAP